MTVVSDEHSPYDPECNHAIHCEVHNKDEPTEASTFRVCLECNHVFPSEWALRHDDLLARQEMIAHMATWGEHYPEDHPWRSRELWPTEDIESCPHCTHSF